MQDHPNLAARAGRWSATHRKTAILGWLAFVAVAAVLGGSAGFDYQRNEDLETGESGRASQVIAAAFAQHATEQVLVQSRDGATIEDPRCRAVLLPAAMKLLGDRNWYLPGWLEWLPQVRREAPARGARRRRIRGTAIPH